MIFMICRPFRIGARWHTTTMTGLALRGSGCRGEGLRTTRRYDLCHRDNTTAPTTREEPHPTPTTNGYSSTQLDPPQSPRHMASQADYWNARILDLLPRKCNVVKKLFDETAAWSFLEIIFHETVQSRILKWGKILYLWKMDIIQFKLYNYLRIYHKLLYQWPWYLYVWNLFEQKYRPIYGPGRTRVAYWSRKRNPIRMLANELWIFMRQVVGSEIAQGIGRNSLMWCTGIVRELWSSHGLVEFCIRPFTSLDDVIFNLYVRRSPFCSFEILRVYLNHSST